ARMIAQSFPTDTYFLHSNHLQSDTQVTDHAGAVLQDQLYYPWGQMWTTGGTMVDSHFAGFQQSGSNLNGTPNRLYANPQGRWLTPDPAGKKAVHLGDPQTWNMYAYVRNNPTTLTDPSGLDVWLQGCGEESDTCHGDYGGSWNGDHTDFTRTHLSGNLTGSATADTTGISVKYNGDCYNGG